MGTVSGSDAAIKLLDGVRATLRITFRPRFELRVPRFFFDLPFVAKSSADYADLRRFRQDRIHGGIVEQAHLPAVALAKAGRLRPRQPKRLPCNEQHATLCAAHIGAGAGIDLDGFAFLDEKRNVDGLAGFELCRLGDVTGSVAAQTFR